jgi:hypothetical protein
MNLCSSESIFFVLASGLIAFSDGRTNCFDSCIAIAVCLLKSLELYISILRRH